MAGSIRIDRHSLLPIDFTRFARPQRQQPPLITLAPQALLERLAAEYVYAQLCEAAMQAFVAENDARMAAMAAAKNNTESKLAALKQREQQRRQEEITTEIVELATGAEASRTTGLNAVTLALTYRRAIVMLPKQQSLNFRFWPVTDLAQCPLYVRY